MKQRRESTDAAAPAPLRLVDDDDGGGEALAPPAARAGEWVDPWHTRYAEAEHTPIGEHVGDYLTFCRQQQHGEADIANKARTLDRFIDGAKLSRLPDLTAEKLAAHLARLRDDGLAAWTVNGERRRIMAFANWAVKAGRMPRNPMTLVKQLRTPEHEQRRRKREYKPHELARLFSVAAARGRRLWYLTAALTGLRVSELARLTWSMIDLDEGRIVIPEGMGKAKDRRDQLPLHPVLAEALRVKRDELKPHAQARVFPRKLSARTWRRDLLRAGLARRVPVLDDDGEPVMQRNRKGELVRVTRIDSRDEAGRQLTFHGLRGTLATMLARNGVPAEITRRMLRHADIATTLRHYEFLDLADMAKAIGKVAAPGASRRRVVNDAPTDEQPAAAIDIDAHFDLPLLLHPAHTPKPSGRRRRANPRLCGHYVERIKALPGDTYPATTIARVVGVSPTAIAKIRKGASWSDIKPVDAAEARGWFDALASFAGVDPSAAPVTTFQPTLAAQQVAFIKALPLTIAHNAIARVLGVTVGYISNLRRGHRRADIEPAEPATARAWFDQLKQQRAADDAAASRDDDTAPPRLVLSGTE